MECILIADDHEIVRSGIRLMIEGFSKNMIALKPPPLQK